MKFHVVVLLCAFAAVSIPWTNCFNVETKHCTVYREEQQSMFGFSVAEHQDKDRRGWVIVGAPEAESFQPDVYRGGSVYRCDIFTDDSCSPIYFDTRGSNFNNHPTSPVQVDNKTMQWFGATVSTSQTMGGPILACAPRYVWFSGNLIRREPVGTCYITQSSFSNPKEFSPCRTRHWGYHRQGSCQAGLGAALSKDGERVIIGAPGSYYWQGQVYSVDSSAEFPYVPSRWSFFGEPSGQAFWTPSNSLPSVISTNEGNPVDDDAYLGYSVTTGDFEGLGQTGAAVGMPKGNNLQGKVLLFSSNFTSFQKNLTGDQMGAYFGYSVISCDVDGDNLDDLIVGAPMYTVKDNPKMTYETGRVHIFYQGTGPDKFSRSETREGVENRGRFGLSLASLKDIDRDGYQDFAVGAPYGGPHGRGAVYIYHGSATGVLETYSQAIYAEQVSSYMSTFGFSVSGGLDLDGNEYPDIVVGAYESAMATFFRSRPVIKMESFVTFDSKSRPISLEEKDCVLNDGTAVPCFQLDSCLTYTGYGVLHNHQFNVQYVLDTKQSKIPRLFFIDYETKSSINQTIRLSRNDRFCKSFKVFVTPNIRDKLTSFEAEVRMSLVEDDSADSEPRNPRAQLTPVLAASTLRSTTLPIFKVCGEDNICIPNLELQVTPSVKKYLLGSGDRLTIDVLVQNSGEDAYESMYNLELPLGIDYIKIERIDKTEIPVQCSAPNQANNNTLGCEIGNPLPKNSFVHFKVILQPVTTQGMEASYELDMVVNTTNPEAESTLADNTFHLSLPIWVQTDLVIEGSSKPKDVYLSFESYDSEIVVSELEFGPVLTHNYTIRNDGPFNVLEAEAILIWPAQTLGGEELMYLIEQPETAGPINCSTANANYLGLKLDEKRGQNVYRTKGEHSSTATGTDTGVRRRPMQEDFDYGNETDILVATTNSRVSSGRYTQNSSAYYYGSQSRNHHGQYVNQKESGTGIEQGTNIVTGTGSGVTDIYGGRIGTPKNHRGSDNVHEEMVHHEERHNHTGSFQHGWNKPESHHEATDDFRSNQDSTDAQRRWSEAERLAANRLQRTEEERLRQMGRHRVEEAEEIGHHEEERLENSRRQKPIQYGVERHYATNSDTENRHRAGFQETSGQVFGNEHQHGSRTSDINLQLTNILSSKDLEKFFSTMKTDSAAFNTYSRGGKEYVLFDGRFRVSDGREFIEFRNGQVFELLDSNGNPSYTADRNQANRFLSIEGQLMGSEEGKIYVELKDKRRFQLPGTYTYERKQTITLGGGPHETVTSNHNYGREITHEGRFEPYGDSYHQEFHEEKYSSEKKVVGGSNGNRYANVRDTFGGDNVPTNRPEDRLSRYPRESDVLEVGEFRKFERKQRRHQRDVQGQSSTEGLINTEEPLCSATKCVQLRCTLGPMMKDEEVWISMRSRVKAQTLKKLAFNEEVKLSTQLITRVTRQPYIDAPIGQPTKSHEIYTTIHPSAAVSAPEVVPLWVVVLSACAGAIILLLLVYLLYKCGFFKRNRPNDAPERQPLNKNGHFSNQE